MKEKYKYDISISFASEDRSVALCIYLALQLYAPKSNGYYYPENQKEMIGQDLRSRLTEIYAKESKYVVLLVSKNYVDVKKEAIQTEIKAFVARYKNQKKTYLIPVILDDTPLEKVHKSLRGITFFKWNYNPKELLGTINETLVEQNKSFESYKQKSIFIKYKNYIKSNNTVINQNQGDNHFNF
jgi:hypothetical protein